MTEYQLSKINAATHCVAAFAICACGQTAEPVDAEPAFPNLRQQYVPTGQTWGYVANRWDDTVSIVNLDTFTVVGRVPIGRDPVVVDGPRHLIQLPSQEAFFTVLSYPHEVVSPHVVEFGGSIRAGYVQMLDAVDFRSLGEARADVRAADAALAPDGSQLAIVHYDTLRSIEEEQLDARRTDVLLVDDPGQLRSGTSNERRIKGCVAAAAITYGKDASRAFVVCTGEDAIGVIDTVSGEMISMVPSGSAPLNKPWTITVDASGSRLLVANQQANTVSVLTADDSPVLLATGDAPGQPYQATWLGDDEFVIAMQQPNATSRINAASGETLATIQYRSDECENPHEPVYVPDGRLFLVCEGDHYSPGAAVQLDAGTLEVVGRVELGLYPERMWVAPK